MKPGCSDRRALSGKGFCPVVGPGCLSDSPRSLARIRLPTSRTDLLLISPSATIRLFCDEPLLRLFYSIVDVLYLFSLVGIVGYSDGALSLRRRACPDRTIPIEISVVDLGLPIRKADFILDFPLLFGNEFASKDKA